MSTEFETLTPLLPLQVEEGHPLLVVLNLEHPQLGTAAGKQVGYVTLL